MLSVGSVAEPAVGGSNPADRPLRMLQLLLLLLQPVSFFSVSDARPQPSKPINPVCVYSDRHVFIVILATLL